MDERIKQAVAGEEAYIVGGAVRDELLGRPVVDVDVVCPAPEEAARRYARAARGALFPLSEQHEAWRVAFRDGRTVDFTPLRAGLEADLRTRDFTLNAIAVPVAVGGLAPGGLAPERAGVGWWEKPRAGVGWWEKSSAGVGWLENLIDPLGGVADLDARRLRAVSDSIFVDDPLRLLRAVRLEDELGFRLDEHTERLVREHARLVARPAGERILSELVRLSADGFRRADELGVLEPLGGSSERLDSVEPVDSPEFRLVCVFGKSLFGLPISNETRRFAKTLLAAKRPQDASPREIHRFRHATEPWALEALSYVGAGDLAEPVRAARAREPAEPLLRGDELGLSPGPEVGRLLDRVAEERAAGTISTREEALELVREEQRRGRADGAEPGGVAPGGARGEGVGEP